MVTKAGAESARPIAGDRYFWHVPSYSLLLGMASELRNPRLPPKSSYTYNNYSTSMLVLRGHCLVQTAVS